MWARAIRFDVQVSAVSWGSLAIGQNPAMRIGYTLIRERGLRARRNRRDVPSQARTVTRERHDHPRKRDRIFRRDGWISSDHVQDDDRAATILFAVRDPSAREECRGG